MWKNVFKGGKMEMKKVRIVIGDFVHSKNDYDRHYVNALELCKLYGFNPQECIIAEADRPESLLGLSSTMPRFTVRYDGDYGNKEYITIDPAVPDEDYSCTRETREVSLEEILKKAKVGFYKDKSIQFFVTTWRKL